MLSKEDFEAWLGNPATAEILAALRFKAQMLMKDTQLRMWESLPLDQAAQVTVAEIKGKVQMLLDIASWTPADFEVVSLEKDRDPSGW